MFEDQLQLQLSEEAKDFHSKMNSGTTKITANLLKPQNLEFSSFIGQ